MKAPACLLDVNTLIALIDSEHVHHAAVMRWLAAHRGEWGGCAISEAGALRVLTNPAAGQYGVADVSGAIDGLQGLPRFRYWESIPSWWQIPETIRGKVSGHQQITDCFLLGAAVLADGSLVTLDKAMRHMAGARFARHLLVLE